MEGRAGDFKSVLNDFRYVEIHEYIISNVKTSTITIASIWFTENSLG